MTHNSQLCLSVCPTVGSKLGGDLGTVTLETHGRPLFHLTCLSFLLRPDYNVVLYVVCCMLAICQLWPSCCCVTHLCHYFYTSFYQVNLPENTQAHHCNVAAYFRIILIQNAFISSAFHLQYRTPELPSVLLRELDCFELSSDLLKLALYMNIFQKITV